MYDLDVSVKFRSDQNLDQKISLQQSIACFSLALSTVIFCFSIFFQLTNCN
jgi:hypothetical protein